MTQLSISNRNLLVGWAGIIAICALTYLVIKPFIGALAWAVLLVITTWPAYRQLKYYLRKLSNRFAEAAPLIMTGLLTIGIFAIFLPLFGELAKELNAVLIFSQQIDSKQKLESLLVDIPLIGSILKEHLAYTGPQLAQIVIEHQGKITATLASTLQGVGKALFTTLFALFTSFFLYKYGEKIRVKFADLAYHVGGSKTEAIIVTLKATLIGTVYGILLTALVQGALAGIGFYFAGSSTPLLYAALVTIVSPIPFGAPLIYLPAIGAMYYHGGELEVLIPLLLWCIAIVSTADNFLRPIFVSQTVNMSFYLVVIGILGGLLAFGFIGLFYGPVIMAASYALWSALTENDGGARINTPTD